VAERVEAPFLQRQCDHDRESRNIGSTLTFVAHVVASLDKALYDGYLCFVASNKQQIKW